MAAARSGRVRPASFEYRPAASRRCGRARFLRSAGDVGSTHVFFDGNRSLSRAELLAAIQSDDPREFESVIVERDVMLINELYYDHGYVSVRAGRYASGSG